MTVDQNWMLDEVTVVRGVRHAVVLSADGLVRTHSAQTSKDDAERLAAACAGLKSIGQSLARQFGTGVAMPGKSWWSSTGTAVTCSCAGPATARTWR